MFLLASFATGFAAIWWETDQFDISDDERGAYDNGLKKFTGNEKPLARLLGLGRVTKSNDIVIVGLDDATFSAIRAYAPWRDRYGGFPYDRRLWSDLFEYLDNV